MKNSLICVAIFVCLTCWMAAIRRVRRGRPLVAYQPRRRVPWGVGDLLFALSALLLFHTLGIKIAGQFELPDTSEQVAEILAGAIASLAAVGTSVAMIFLHAGARWRDFGLERRYLLADIRLGGLAFLMLAPPVYGIQHLLIQWFPSKHPLISLLTGQGSPIVFLVVGFSATVVAPLTEEYLFRLLLQGWTEDALATRDAEPVSSRWFSFGRRVRELKHRNNSTGSSTPGTASGWIAILVSATLFAALHASHGPDPIPLFLLALGLGYLYQRTHRIVPSITVHFLLNSVTLATFLLQGA
jgi:membrane protease YdiL (CAAX protease family)